ncbi:MULTISPECIES: hypothetical protein [unclassified Fibrobacter]|uniref:hypothetical protein n=1 Tax=unclassified Fibrobacter TaxID=2634177 RepID=UPI0025BA7F4E|nr:MULTISPECIES: hypothetical protein [unclassified Fibrobacter]
MSDVAEFAKALKLVNHEHFPILYGLKEKLDNLAKGTFSEIGTFALEKKDKRRLYLAYYFTYPKDKTENFKCTIEYKFVISVNREEPKGILFFLGFRRKDNKEIDDVDKQNCADILTQINSKLHTNYGFSNGGHTLYLNPLFEENLNFFIKEAFNNSILNLGIMGHFADESNGEYITLRQAEVNIKTFK